ncbi:MAG: adenylyl-sulfate kinase [Rhodocyclales bacterium]|nr:adenylyl-sulfate kinase [Rhodocyclales bacterium]
MNDNSKPSSGNVIWHQGRTTNDARRHSLAQNPMTVWLTGLSGSGKSTVAYDLEYELIQRGYKAFVLDGDNVRHGLCRDLGFSAVERTENIRRVAEVARLMNDSGLVVISAFISPYERDREEARQVIGDSDYFEVHLSAPLSVCASRDPKGLYEKARQGRIPDFTGISAPYEIPSNPAIRLDTGELDRQKCIDLLLEKLIPVIRY